MEFAKAVCNKLTDRGHWADYIDPCSGLPVTRLQLLTNSCCCVAVSVVEQFVVFLCFQMMHRDFTVPYGEVDGFSTLLGYKTANAAGCKVRLLCICAHLWVRLSMLEFGITSIEHAFLACQMPQSNCSACSFWVQVMLHPQFGTASYPATLFTKAPVTILRVVIEEVEAEATNTGYYQSFMSI